MVCWKVGAMNLVDGLAASLFGILRSREKPLHKPPLWMTVYFFCLRLSMRSVIQSGGGVLGSGSDESR